MNFRILISVFSFQFSAFLFAAAGDAPDKPPPPKTALEIDAGFPGGNIAVIGIEGDTVRLKDDPRKGGGTEAGGIYWAFRVRGAAGRTLTFQFEEDFVGLRGPSVSADGGKTWRWLENKPAGALSGNFSYSFGAGENEALFSSQLFYTEKNLKSFLEKHKAHPALKTETLCKTNKGRGVELLRINEAGQKAKFKVLLTARHHARETTASPVLEGIMEAVLSSTPDGRWLRENADFFIVPFIDKDGVEDGDQGKNRSPHDHNRDYARGIHPEIRAIKEQVPPWLGGRPLFFIDLHGTSQKGKTIFFIKRKTADELSRSIARFSTILEKERKGPLPFKAALTVQSPDKQPPNPSQAAVRGDGVTSVGWTSRLPGVIFAATLEFPYSTVGSAALTADSTRLFGKDMARAIRVFLETNPPPAENSNVQ